MKACNNCGDCLGKRNISGLCEKCRVKEWHIGHKERVSEIKMMYVLRYPEKRRQSWEKYNHEKKDRRRKSNIHWYDKVMFSGKRLLLLNSHPFCARCFSNKAKLHVHHRDGNGTTSVIKNNDWNNLVVLCNRCHKIVHSRKEYPYVVS